MFTSIKAFKGVDGYQNSSIKMYDADDLYFIKNN